MRTIWLSVVFVAAVLIVLHHAKHAKYANAHEPTLCGFWSTIEAILPVRAPQAACLARLASFAMVAAAVCASLGRYPPSGAGKHHRQITRTQNTNSQKSGRGDRSNSRCG